MSITLNQAKSIAKQNNPELEVFNSVETSKAYLLHLNSKDGFANSSTYVVYKDGSKPEWVPITALKEKTDKIGEPV